MKKTKTILLALLLVAVMAVMTGCGDKTPLTLDEFKTSAEEYGCEIKDITDQYASFDFVETATLAVMDNWQVEFYELASEEDAVRTFNTNKNDFENLKGSASTESSVAIGNHAKYTLNSNGKYMHIARIGNTFVFTSEDKDEKESIEGLLEKIGY